MGKGFPDSAWEQGNMTHVSGIKTVAGTEKILVPKMLIHSVKQGG